MKHRLSMTWEKIPAKNEPGHWYVVESIGDFPNRLRIGPMKGDQVEQVIAERQAYQKQMIREALKNLGMDDLDIDIQTNYTSKPVDK